MTVNKNEQKYSLKRQRILLKKKIQFETLNQIYDKTK